MRNAIIFGVIAFGGMCLVSMCNKPLHRYVGTVIEVSSWDGQAQLKTKGLHNQDTVITVICKRRERFVVGQVITAWSGGDLIRDDVATTDPQTQP
jgi:hypothetical protein